MAWPPLEHLTATELTELLSNFYESTSLPAKLGPAKGTPSLHLYSRKGENLSYTHLSSPRAWQDVFYARPGWVPEHLQHSPA